MYLKRLELQGFKSFPDKIKLDFKPGVTAVVGPNGSGKSNISDAVRWVLGEQSAKSLRGAKMEDVIFAGTQNRRPLGFAEVAIVVDNSDYKMPVEYNEITVTRRVYRSGESQFLINGTACRLKDIHELFMDTGIGREGYSIIGQGRIDEILSSKSEDRRLLFEEAAGIVKYKNRKQDAENKLEREKQNLIRVNDIIHELETQLEPLRKQSEKTKTYLDLTERKKLLSINIFVQEASRVEGELLGMDKNIDDIKSQLESETLKQEEDRKTTEDLKIKHEKLEEESEEYNEKLTELKLSSEKKQNDIRLIEQTIEHTKSDITRLTQEIENRKNSIVRNAESITTYESKNAGINLELSSKKEEETIKKTELSELSEKLSESEQLIEKFTSEHIEHLRKTNDARSKIERAEMMYEQLEQRKEELDEEKDENRERVNVIQNEINELDDKIILLEKELHNLNKQNESLEEDRDRIIAEVQTLKKELEEVSKKYQDALARYKFLVEMESNFDGYYKSTKSVLMAKKNNPSDWLGIKGAVAELIQVDEQYETAIEIALGASLQNIITETEKDAQKAIEHLKRTKDGRVTFLPISAIKSRDLSEREAEKFSVERGFIGIGKNLVKYSVEYEQIFSNLLGKVLIFDTLDNAVEFSKKYKFMYKLVTLEGDLINPGGALTGGSVNKGVASLLSRSREIEVYKNLVSENETIKDKCTYDLQMKTNQRNSIFDLIEKNKVMIQENRLSKTSLETETKQKKTLLEQYIEKSTDLDREERQLMEQIVEINKTIRRFKDEQRLIEMEISDILKTVEEHQKTVNENKTLKDKKTKELTKIQVEISGLKENLLSVQENIRRINDEIENIKLEITRNENDIVNCEITIENKTLEIEQLKEDISEINERRLFAEKSIEELRLRKEELNELLSTSEKRAFETIELLAKLNNEISRLEMKKEQIETDTRKLYDEMWEEYNLTYQKALEYPLLNEPLSKLQREERELRGSIRDLGSVNVNAIEEYKTVSERYDFMSKQRDDIIEAENKLIKIMDQLNELMEKQFADQFKLISENFSIVFSEMFTGGTAYLQLSDEKNVLESGIDIIAQPPGKRLQNMTLLSGGERALTAIALLFAILRMKPSPFCILDEIEAALDDANVKRFGNYLNNFSADTQFIVITHRKGTMEAADVLYGVTMQEQGVSKLVSVKFTDDDEFVS